MNLANEFVNAHFYKEVLNLFLPISLMVIP